MRRLTLPLLITFGLVLSACAGTPAVSTSTSAGLDDAHPSPTKVPSPTMSAESAPPGGCVDYEPTELQPADGGDLGAAAASAEVGADVRLFEVQVISSVDEAGLYEAVARVCGAPMDEDRLIEIGNAIGAAIYESPAAETLAVLTVSAWQPGGEFLEEGETIIAPDYQSYLWDNTTGALDAAWQ